MAKATFVKKARKDIEGTDIKKGDSYYHWSPGFRGPKRYSKTPPRASQLTNNDFLCAVYSVEEEIEDYKVGEDLKPKDALAAIAEIESSIETWKGQVEEAMEEYQGRYDELPQGFQDGDTGQLMLERIEQAQSFIDELDALDVSEPDEAEAVERLEALLEELKGLSAGL